MSEANGNGGAAAGGETREIVRKQPKPLSLRDPAQLARAFAESAYWDHVTTPAQAVVIMAAGEELGLTPLASMQGITMIEGNIGYRGNLIAQLIRQHDHYSFKIIERTNERCTLQFLEDGTPVDGPDAGRVTFTLEDAQRMELVKPGSGWIKTPRSMCFYRCLTEGARVYFPDLTMGTPVYSTEEIEEIVSEPVVVDAEVVEDAMPETVAPEQAAHLVELWKKVEPIFEADERNVNALDGLNVMLGSLGIDGFKGNVQHELEQLTPAQGEQVAEGFQAVLDEEGLKAEAAQ